MPSTGMGDNQRKRGKHNKRSDKRKQGRQERRKERKHRNEKKIVLCDEQGSCDTGLCCVMVNGTQSCRNLTTTHGKQCHHDCQCAEGIHCVKKNVKHHSKRAGHCIPIENAEEVAGEQTTPMTHG
ncbi:uncharacterized protein LOC117114226 [Anneissia japonica]|uniref:uncharacterized protein LOC117114226 n=1 Tax=Anneissia japonica TaxID=1529436 RepID=UPI001425A281|nr:uncharacterized protein LOC117114226 [Anneissia japonica]